MDENKGSKIVYFGTEFQGAYKILLQSGLNQS